MKHGRARTSRSATVEFKRKTQALKSKEEQEREKASLRTYFIGGGDDIA
ncbi:hypothetical protein [Paenibacillus sp. BIHB 4019]|nr:hypothetical protein [Paenibacillus sp. BIHB 4019]